MASKTKAAAHKEAEAPPAVHAAGPKARSVEDRVASLERQLAALLGPLEHVDGRMRDIVKNVRMAADNGGDHAEGDQ